MKQNDTFFGKCGAVHPNHPELTCVKYGKCVVDGHMGLYYHSNGRVEYVVWGSIYDDKMNPTKSYYRVISITTYPQEEQNDRK